MLLHRHYAKLNENKYYRAAKKIFIPENNLGMESAHLDTMVHDLQDVETFWEKGRAGVCKDGKATRGYQFLLTCCLAENGMRFDMDAFTITKEKTLQCMKELLEDQMCRFHWEKKKANDVHSKDRYTLTGKVGNKQDDLLITVAMLLYWGRIVVADYQNKPRS